jgi:hypothetical protein
LNLLLQGAFFLRAAVTYLAFQQTRERVSGSRLVVG